MSPQLIYAGRIIGVWPPPSFWSWIWTIICLQPRCMTRRETSCWRWFFNPLLVGALRFKSFPLAADPAMLAMIYSCKGWLRLLIAELDGIYCKRPSGSSTFSQESWELAKGWLASCSREHEACGKGTKTSWYPTRLLDLSDPSADLSSIRLRLIGSEPIDTEYVTLSHRWGQASIFRLTKDTFTGLRDGFDSSILPQTFQDAMAFAKRNLKIRYMWIDSLCIFQDADDCSDWIKEAAQMHRVYEHAYCNLSATGGEDSSVGLYRPRRTDSLCHVEVDLTFSILDPQASPTRYAMLDYFYWEKELSKCPLHYRGWVVQERLLARRVLHFCRNELIWECNEMAASEAYPTGLPSIYRNQAKARLKSLDPDTEGGGWDNSRRQSRTVGFLHINCGRV